MVIIGKLDTKHMDLAAYEQYGNHQPPSLGTAYAWAGRNSKRYGKKDEGK